jgi:hypothetical protein
MRKHLGLQRLEAPQAPLAPLALLEVLLVPQEVLGRCLLPLKVMADALRGAALVFSIMALKLA